MQFLTHGVKALIDKQTTIAIQEGVETKEAALLLQSGRKLTVYMATKITITDVANAIHFVKAPKEVVVIE